MKVLHIDSSARFDRSHTRMLSAEFVARLQQLNPEIVVVRRDLALRPPMPVTQEWISAAFSKQATRSTEMEDALGLSDQLVEELLRSDLYVIATPMYNYGVPAVLKGYIDQVVRVGRTFSFDPQREQQYEGLLRNKAAVIITARGEAGYGPEGPNWEKNHADRYLAQVLQFLGVERVESVAVEHDEFGGAELRNSLAAARCSLHLLAEEMMSPFAIPA